MKNKNLFTLNCTPIVRHILTIRGAVFYMTKFTAAEKLTAVKRYLEGRETAGSIGESMGTSKQVVANWVMQYQYQGEEGLLKKSYTSYTAEFKLDVLKYMNDHGTSPNETAAIFKITSPALIRKWRRQFESQGIDALESKKKGRPLVKKEKKESIPVEGSVEALQAEIERLRMENAYLKKLNALVQSKEKLQSKTKLK
jgi:transposase